MLNMRDLTAQAKALAPVVRDFVVKAIAPISAKLEELEKSLLEIKPAPDAEEIAEKAAALVKLPEVRDGKDADPAEIERMVSEAVASIPVPKDGKDADLDEIKSLVAAAVSEIPKPVDGKDADPELIKELVFAAIAEIPAPKDGQSVTIDDVRPLIADEIGKAVAEIPKPQDGKSVDVAEVQRMVSEAVAAAVSAIQLPKDGKDGEVGRDAAELEIMPEIDTAKSYARGTYAQHANGLWRAYERTHGMKGWECIVSGVAEIEITQHDERNYSVTSKLSNGKEVSKTFAVPAMIYRNVFVPGEYHPGDTVTWGGSLWHCSESTSDKPGEVGSKGWTLAAKRGRDGKDGRNGIDKTQGVKIQ